MAEIQSSESIKKPSGELLYFWALGDLHYCSIDQWQAFHTQRLTSMFQDLRTLWAEEGAPAFCVSPGGEEPTHGPTCQGAILPGYRESRVVC
jgi:hypothetical protein